MIKTHLRKILLQTNQAPVSTSKIRNIRHTAFKEF